MAKNEAAVALGRLRMSKLTWAERSALGKLAAQAKKNGRRKRDRRRVEKPS
jgi:hypothetical protein